MAPARSPLPLGGRAVLVHPPSGGSDAATFVRRRRIAAGEGFFAGLTLNSCELVCPSPRLGSTLPRESETKLQIANCKVSIANVHCSICNLQFEPLTSRRWLRPFSLCDRCAWQLQTATRCLPSCRKFVVRTATKIIASRFVSSGDAPTRSFNSRHRSIIT
jgi:hypothetical protein